MVLEGWRYELRGPFLIPVGPAKSFPSRLTVEGRVYKMGALADLGVFPPTYRLEDASPEWQETPPTVSSGKGFKTENWSFDAGRGRGSRTRGSYEVPDGSGYFERESTQWSSSTSR